MLLLDAIIMLVWDEAISIDSKQWHRWHVCIVAGNLSDHVQPRFPWDGLTIFEPHGFGYVGRDNPR